MKKMYSQLVQKVLEEESLMMEETILQEASIEKEEGNTTLNLKKNYLQNLKKCTINLKNIQTRK